MKLPNRKPQRTRLNCEQLEDRSVPAVAFALSGTNLLSFDTANPATTQTTAISGVNGSEVLVGIDFRPQNGHLYGLGVNATSNTGTLYNISTRTGFASAVGTTGSIAFTTDGSITVDLPDPATFGYGFDFNPAADRIRVVAGSLNFRVNPNTGQGIDGDNDTGSPVTGTNPDGNIDIIGSPFPANAVAYTNNQPNTTITTLYTLARVGSNDELAIQNTPNSGSLTNELF